MLLSDAEKRLGASCWRITMTTAFARCLLKKFIPSLNVNIKFPNPTVHALEDIFILKCVSKHANPCTSRRTQEYRRESCCAACPSQELRVSGVQSAGVSLEAGTKLQTDATKIHSITQRLIFRNCFVRRLNIDSYLSPPVGIILPSRFKSLCEKQIF